MIINFILFNLFIMIVIINNLNNLIDNFMTNIMIDLLI